MQMTGIQGIGFWGPGQDFFRAGLGAEEHAP